MPVRLRSHRFLSASLVITVVCADDIFNLQPDVNHLLVHPPSSGPELSDQHEQKALDDSYHLSPQPLG